MNELNRKKEEAFRRADEEFEESFSTHLLAELERKERAIFELRKRNAEAMALLVLAVDSLENLGKGGSPHDLCRGGSCYTCSDDGEYWRWAHADRWEALQEQGEAHA